MARKHLLILGAVVLLGFVVAGGVQHHFWSYRVARSRLIDPDYCERIKEGMSQAEVEAILGGPAGDYTTKRVGFICWTEPLGHDSGRMHEHDWGRMQQWRGDRGGVMVFFTEHGTVEAAVPCWTTAPYDLTPLERFWYWLRQLLPSEKKGENKEDAAALGRKWKKVTL